jgi:hypothetical protein
MKTLGPEKPQPHKLVLGFLRQSEGLASSSLEGPTVERLVLKGDMKGWSRKGPT